MRFPSRLPPALVLQFLEPRDLVIQAGVSVGWRDAADVIFRQVEALELAMDLATTADADYMRRQPHINKRMRLILVDWLADVCRGHINTPETLHLTVNIIDRYLSVAPSVSSKKLQLVGVAALGVAACSASSKYLEQDKKLSWLCDHAYPPAEICAMRATLTSALGPNMTIVSSRRFVMRYLKAGSVNVVSRDAVWLASYVAERMLQEYEMLKYRPSLVAACAVYVARGSLENGRVPAWTKMLQRCSRYSEDDLRSCLADVKRFMDRPLPNQQCGSIDRKFRSTRRGPVASTPLRIGNWSFHLTMDGHSKTQPILFQDSVEEMSVTGTLWLSEALEAAGWFVGRSRRTGRLFYANSQEKLWCFTRPSEPRTPTAAPPTGDDDAAAAPAEAGP